MKFPVRHEQPLWDRVLMSFFIVIYAGWHVLMGVDAKRIAWSNIPVWLQAIGALLVLVGNLVTMEVFRVNSFAAPVVRHQVERKQRVITTGVYAYIRHPMYAGAMIYLIGTPLLVSSWMGLMAMPLIVLMLSMRIGREEKLLREELEGYDEYASKVRWRLIPRVW
jgi:protein-S-isoprenylcysteine O-methyltransferase Ste14